MARGKHRAVILEWRLLHASPKLAEPYMPTDRDSVLADEEALQSNDDLDQEVYAALRAAGASPEEARSCLQTGVVGTQT